MKLILPLLSAVTALFVQLANGAAVNATSRALCGDPNNDIMSPLRRLYNPTLTDHFITINGYDEAIYVTELGYLQEGDPTTTGFASISGMVFFDQASGTVPFFRLYNSATSTHLYIADPLALSSALSSGYAYEGLPYDQISGYVYLTGDCPGVVPLYWAHSDALTDNYYTVFPDNYNAYIANGYTGMGIIAWIYPHV